MKPFLQFLKEDLSPELHNLLEPYEEFPPVNPRDDEEKLYKDVEFLNFPHYMKTQIDVVSRYIASQGITDEKGIQKALNDAFMKPEIQQAFRLHYARKFPNNVKQK